MEAMAHKLNERDIINILEDIDGNMSELSDLDEEEEDENYIQAQPEVVSDDPVPVLEDIAPDDNTPEELPESNYPRLTWKKDVYNPNVPVFVEIPKDIPDQVSTPLEYFRKVISDEILDMIAEETNLYSTQKTGISVNTSRAEIEKILGVYLRMGLCQMPSIRCYWETNLAYSLVSEVLPRNRFEKLLSCLHFVNNLTVTDADKVDKLWKIRPFLEKFRNSCLLETPEENNSVDEMMMIAFKGRSHLRQFMQNKPTRWGFKVWGRAGSSGYLYDFDVYQGAAGNKTGKREIGKGVGYEVVMKLTNSLPEGHNFKVFADNFFTTDILVQSLLERNIYFLGTVRVNRLKDCPLPLEKEMKKQGRGSVASLVDTTNQFIVVRWYDNKPVTLLSSFIGVEPVEVRRWDKASKKHIQVKRPSVVKEYNKFMGGLDLLDMLSSLYKYHIKSRRWYMYIFWHLVTVAVINSWIRYRKDCVALNEKHLPLRKFQADLAAALILAGKGKSKRGRPSAEDMPPQKRRAATTVMPVLDCQKDKFEHWPVWKDKRERCKICKDKNSSVWCEKCEVYLCFNQKRNCFRRFHV